MATKKGINDIVMLLLDRGADIGSTDKVNYNEMKYLELHEINAAYHNISDRKFDYWMKSRCDNIIIMSNNEMHWLVSIL